LIGVIGPADSVRHALSIASEDGLAESVIGRTYETVDEAPALARELDRICQVLLFTGRVAFVLGTRQGGLEAAVQHVPHSGADLYAAVVRLLREHGDLPRMSMDTIAPKILAEAFEDLGLDPPQHVLPLDVERGQDGARAAAELVAFHQKCYRAGDVDVCLTCVGSVYRGLISSGVPAVRITHTKSVVREALRQAHLTERLAITEALQPAVVLISLPRTRLGTSEEAGPYEAQRQQLRAREAVLDIAERLQGRLADVDDVTSIVYASRGTIESALARVSDGHDGPLSLERLPANVQVGIGLGRTVAAAEENARLALTMGERDGALHIGLPDGEVVRVGRGRPATTYRLREIHPSALRVAEELGIGPLALTRLTQALRQVDASSVTAAELARAYGIEARSARRIITSLQRAGIATRLGRQGGPGAGRPQTVYRVDLERLVGSEQERS
jgi:hypothetical protein